MSDIRAIAMPSTNEMRESTGATHGNIGGNADALPLSARSLMVTQETRMRISVGRCRVDSLFVRNWGYPFGSSPGKSLVPGSAGEDPLASAGITTRRRSSSRVALSASWRDRSGSRP